MVVRGLTIDQVLGAAAAAGVVLTKPPRQRGASWCLTIRAKSREDRARGYRELSVRIFEANPEATIEPCWVGGVLLYGRSEETIEYTVTPEDAVPVGISADRWADYNRKFCALLHRGSAD